MKPDESEKVQVMAAIKENNGNISFESLMDISGLTIMELSSVIGRLLKERRIGLYVPCNAECNDTYRPRMEALFTQFMDLLSAHYMQERSVRFYASALCITSKYLSAAVKQASGKTPAAWITEKVINEIKYRLLHSQATVKEIAFELNFCNISFFGKYFKSRTGMSPLHYRMANGNRTEQPIYRSLPLLQNDVARREIR